MVQVSRIGSGPDGARKINRGGLSTVVLGSIIFAVSAGSSDSLCQSSRKIRERAFSRRILRRILVHSVFAEGNLGPGQAILSLAPEEIYSRAPCRSSRVRNRT